MFDKNIKATELILRIILGRKIKVISVSGQEEERNAEVGGRNITLDVYVNGTIRGMTRSVSSLATVTYTTGN